MAWLQDIAYAFMEWAVLIALALGATLAVWILDACVHVAGRVSRNPLGGLFLFLFLMVGVPILAVIWGFANGRLPVVP